jgi:hypothetical protein
MAARSYESDKARAAEPLDATPHAALRNALA